MTSVTQAADSASGAIAAVQVPQMVEASSIAVAWMAVFIGAMGVLFAVGAVLAAILLWRQGAEFKRLREKLFADVRNDFATLLAERNQAFEDLTNSYRARVEKMPESETVAELRRGIEALGDRLKDSTGIASGTRRQRRAAFEIMAPKQRIDEFVENLVKSDRRHSDLKWMTARYLTGTKNRLLLSYAVGSDAAEEIYAQLSIEFGEDAVSGLSTDIRRFPVWAPSGWGHPDGLGDSPGSVSS